MDFLSDRDPEQGASSVSVAEAATANQFVTFTCGQRLFGIEIMSVREIGIQGPHEGWIFQVDESSCCPAAG